MSIKLLHVADVHLDAPFRWLGQKGSEQRAQLKETFRGVVDLAMSERVDCLLVAGDLFDSNSPAQDTIDLVQGQLARLPMPVLLLPGTHDCLDDTSIYRRLRFAGQVHVFDEDHTAFRLGPDLTIHGKANLTRTSAISPLRDLKRDPGARFNVALAHGSLAMPGTERDFPIAADDIQGSGMDYVALGHWHSRRDCSANATKACYSGPPELLAEKELGCVLLVELSEMGAKIEPRPVSRRRFEHLDIACEVMGSNEEIVAAIRRLRDPDLALSVALTGLRPMDLVVDIRRLAQELGEAFFALHVEDRSHPTLSDDDVAALPEKTVAGQFARRMRALVAEAATPEEQALRGAALQLGLALLRGRRVLG